MLPPFLNRVDWHAIPARIIVVPVAVRPITGGWDHLLPQTRILANASLLGADVPRIRSTPSLPSLSSKLTIVTPERCLNTAIRRENGLSVEISMVHH